MAQRHGLERMKLKPANQRPRPARNRPPTRAAARQAVRGANSRRVAAQLPRARATENHPNTPPAAPARGGFSILIPDQNHSSRILRFGKPAFEFSPRGEHAPGNGGFRAAQNLRGLGVVQSVVNRQHDGGALLGGKFQQARTAPAGLIDFPPENFLRSDAARKFPRRSWREVETAALRFAASSGRC